METRIARGALWLAVAGLVVKALSALQRVLVARWLGAEGVGLFEMAAPLLTAALSLATLGLPVGLSVLVSAAHGRGRPEEALDYRRATLRLLAASGVVVAAALWLGAGRLAIWLGDARAAPVIRAVAPAALLGVLLQAERSWLQGCGRMAGLAASQAVEQMAHVVAALAAARWTVAAPRAVAATAVAWSLPCGAAAGLAACRQARASPVENRGPRRRQTGARAKLFALGLPNGLAGVLVATGAAVDAGLVQWRLQASGLDHDRATALFGELHGMAAPLATAPAVLFGALAGALLPAAAASWARGDRMGLRRQASTAYRWAAIVSCPSAVGLWLVARPLCQLLFANAGAGGPLSVVAWAAIPLGFSQVAAALSNAVGRPSVLLPPLTAGVLVRLGLTALLTGRFGLGIEGAAWALLCGWTVSAWGCVAAVRRIAGTAIPWRPILTRAGVGCLLMGIAANAVYPRLLALGLPFGLALLVTVALAGLCYAPAIVLPFPEAGRW